MSHKYLLAITNEDYTIFTVGLPQSAGPVLTAELKDCSLRGSQTQRGKFGRSWLDCICGGKHARGIGPAPMCDMAANLCPTCGLSPHSPAFSARSVFPEISLEEQLDLRRRFLKPPRDFPNQEDSRVISKLEILGMSPLPGCRIFSEYPVRSL
ncbi:hypothetical protein CROQUDRAFT_85955 [Cronartium quercuum f. sp. fusiforme G11]|uniref:Uncharacterized protein n=1 Tax=Cronartium quercuum f. sp. fusiforme G11 TaxID=708437 RepID=A0A9P6NUL1_9BASI|nr:hypothetical protein CROQUDRAFT_85955 [Cronartium quercuum f. sp. fusiforme G11]